MNLFAKDGSAKLVAECAYPLTGLRCVRRVYTDHAFFELDPTGEAVHVLETFGMSVDEVATRCALHEIRDLGAQTFA
jgi:3-oxoadipate CoA-transferase beta subunit